ncbi:MAG: carboxypeptidase regulatory-like domain-containing protein [Gammaproteobacteria bacterium]|nr:carboxypeptidase regulatory-like domain-containing protein [Gammaproteobacteria bacterium]
MCNRKSITTVISVLAAFGLCASTYAGPYQVVNISNGGAISGKISFTGQADNPILEIGKDQELCGTSIKADYYIVGTNGGLKNAVVAIENIDKGKSYDKAAIIKLDNNKCMFEPHVTVAIKGQKLGVNNSDPILHNTHLYHGPKERTLYNLALPLQNKMIKKKLKRAGNVTVKCDAHEWMLGYVYVAEHPYAEVTSADGSFSIKDIPPGDYTVKIWHEKLGELHKPVTVNAGATTGLDHAFSK